MGNETDFNVIINSFQQWFFNHVLLYLCLWILNIMDFLQYPITLFNDGFKLSLYFHVYEF